MTMSGMGSHDVHAEHRRWVYVCDGCGTAFEDPNDAIDCEDQHGGAT